MGSYHKNKRNLLTRLYGYNIINLAVDDEFIKTKVKNEIDSNKALFSSYPDRNLSTLPSTTGVYSSKQIEDIALAV